MKAQVKKASTGTVLAARMRTEGNKLTDAERERLGEEFHRFETERSQGPDDPPFWRINRELGHALQQ